MTARTPGPWYSRRAAGYDTHGQCVIASEDNGKTVAVTYQDEADAAFIVLACNSHDDLLAQRDALAEALITMVEQFDHYTHYEADQNEVAAIDNARAALAGVKGGDHA